MNQEIKQKLEQAAENYAGEIKIVTEHVKVYNAYFDGAQTILENPQEWGLVGAQWKEDAIHNADTAVEIAAERDRYREVLERLLEENMCSHAGDELIEEALKHNEQ